MVLTLRKLPTLYKHTNSGAIQLWEVFHGETKEGHGVVRTSFGQKDGKLQNTADVLKEGKNIGKKIETSPSEQAALQAKQRWDKKIKSGYQESLEDVKIGKVDLPGIKPMLAHEFDNCRKSVEYPCYVQPKLDGMRVVAVVSEGKCQLYSRTQKAVNTLPHIVKHVEDLCRTNNTPDIIFDGEAYCHTDEDNFNELMSIIRRDEIHPRHEEIEYHIYDLPSQFNTDFRGRHLTLKAFFAGQIGHKNLVLVETVDCPAERELKSLHDHYVSNGYEGIMVRNSEGKYEFKRSKSLLKYKVFQDAEFKVIGVQEGKGKLMGSAGAFICVTESGKEFNCKMEGELSNLKEYFVNFDNEYKGKWLTVKFFNMTVDGAPRFPVGIRFRVVE